MSDSNDESPQPNKFLRGPLALISSIVVFLTLAGTGLTKYQAIVDFIRRNKRHDPEHAPKPGLAPTPIPACASVGPHIMRLWTSRDLQRPSRSSGPGRWTISYPNTSPYENIGWLIEPDQKPNGGVADFAMHDAHSIAGGRYTPDPQFDWVIYEFSEPTSVREVQIRQHFNGVIRILGEMGDAEDKYLYRLGSASVSAQHDVGFQPEGVDQLFTFDSVSEAYPPKGKFLKLTISETVNAEATWATYRLIPRNAGHQPFQPCGIDS